jgi:hypothetical protein
MAFENIRLRPSLGPVAKQCPSAMFHDPRRPDIRTSAHLVQSTTGTALHDIFKERTYRGLPLRDEDLAPYAEKHNVALTGYYGIGWRARQVAEKWAKIAPFYEGAQLETEIACVLKNGFPLRGTPDLFKVNAEFGVILDEKYGESEYDFMAQVELYALILHKRYAAQGVKEWYCALFCPMLEKYVNVKLTAEYLDKLEDKYCEAMNLAGVSYVTGPACPICPRLLSCQAMIRSVDPLNTELRSGRDITPYDIAKFRPSVKLMEQMVEHYKAVERAVLERVGVIDLTNGYELYFKEDFRDQIRPAEAWKILTDEFRIPPEKIVANLKFPKSAVMESARAIAVARDKNKGLGVTQIRIFNALKEQGAVEKVPRKEVAVRQKAVTTNKENA